MDTIWTHGTPRLHIHTNFASAEDDIKRNTETIYVQTPGRRRNGLSLSKSNKKEKREEGRTILDIIYYYYTKQEQMDKD